jgi:Protein of unknown function (DUF1579)
MTRREDIPMKAMLTAAVVSSASLLLFLGATAKDEKPGDEQQFTIPKPGPEHELLKKDAGVWDATVEEYVEPGKPPRVSKGFETGTLACGGLWLISDFKGEMMGQPFQGHGILGYDPAKKKYVGTWVDGMSPALGLVEGTYDAAKKTMTSYYESHDPAGNPMKMKMVTVWTGEDSRAWTAFMAGGDGKDIPVLAMKYQRRK